MREIISAFILKYYPIFINIYLIWMLYKMFFDYNRGDDTLIYEIHFLPFETIFQLLQIDIPLYFKLKNIFGNIILFMPYDFWEFFILNSINTNIYLSLFFLALIISNSRNTISTADSQSSMM